MVEMMQLTSYNTTTTAFWLS